MGNSLLKNQSAAIEHFINDKKNGEAWRRILFDAPAYAMERIAISMFHSVYGKQLSDEEKQQYRDLREEIEASLEREDLEYLIKVMPAKQKEHYRALLQLLPPENVGNASATLPEPPQMSMPQPQLKQQPPQQPLPQPQHPTQMPQAPQG